MKIVFNEEFYNSTYTDDCASVPGRMESIISAIKSETNYQVVSNEKASYSDIQNVHEENYINKIRENKPLYEMSLLSAGGAVAASQIALGGEPAFACIRPPGHHAYRASGWGYCNFCNMAVALKKLKSEGQISSAFVIDFDAHTGDGTKDCLSDIKEFKILNPMAESGDEYMKVIEDYIKDIDYVDIIAVNAGFDSYIKDVGRKLNTFDFYRIGAILKLFGKRIGHNRRFAILEGGYYLPDLGKNVVSFCGGFE